MFEDRDAYGKGVDEIFSGSMDKVEENNSGKSELTGTWKLIKEVIYFDKNYTQVYETYDYEDDEEEYYVEFTSSNNIKMTSYDKNDGKYDTYLITPYEYNKKKQTIEFMDQSNYPVLWNVYSLSTSELEIRYYDDELDNPPHRGGYYKEIYKKVPAIGK